MVRGSDFAFDFDPYWPNILIQPDGEINFSCLEGLLVQTIENSKTVRLRERVSFGIHKRLGGEGYVTGKGSYTVGTLLRLYEKMEGRKFNSDEHQGCLLHD